MAADPFITREKSVTTKSTYKMVSIQAFESAASGEQGKVT